MFHRRRQQKSKEVGPGYRPYRRILGGTTNETHEVEKAVAKDLRKAGKPHPEAGSGFVQRVRVPDSISSLVKAVEKLFRNFLRAHPNELPVGVMDYNGVKVIVN